jgi:hypothetical protein
MFWFNESPLLLQDLPKLVIADANLTDIAIAHYKLRVASQNAKGSKSEGGLDRAVDKCLKSLDWSSRAAYSDVLSALSSLESSGFGPTRFHSAFQFDCCLLNSCVKFGNTVLRRDGSGFRPANALVLLTVFAKITRSVPLEIAAIFHVKSIVVFLFTG